MDSLAKPQIICYNSTSVDYTIHDVKWVPISSRFVSVGGKSNGTGIVEIYSIVDGGVVKNGDFYSREHLKCCTFEGADCGHRRLATGDFLGRLQVWDVEDPIYPTYKCDKAHDDVVNGIDGAEPEVVTGSRDGTVKVWDLRQKDKPVARFVPSTGTVGRDCWTVAFGDHHDLEKCVAAGYDNGDLKLYDLRNMRVSYSTNLGNGVVCIQFDRKDIPMNKLVATTLESKLSVFDLRTFHPTKHYAHLTESISTTTSSTVWTARHLPQNRELFMTTGGAGGMNLWRYEYPERRSEKDSDGIEYGVVGELSLLQRCTMSEQPITSFDWCKEKIGLAVCSAFDQTLRVLIVTKLKLY